MKQRKFTKSPLHKGKYLCLHIGAGDKTINDGEILIGDKFAPYVGMGYLVEIVTKAPEPKSEAKSPAPVEKAPEKDPDPEPDEVKKQEARQKVGYAVAGGSLSGPEDEGGATKSSAHKMLSASKRGGKRRGKK